MIGQTDTLLVEREKLPPLLSICILTINQPNELERLLLSLVGQVTSEVEIIVRDDSNNDDSEIVVNKFSNELGIKYIRGSRQGIDRTISFLTLEASGEFVWWLGDDIIEPAGVAKVLSVIKVEKDLNFIWANYQIHRSNKFGISSQRSSGEINRNELLVAGGAGLGFISCTLIRRNLALEALPLGEKYYGTLFFNLYIVFYVITRPGKLYFLQGPIVTCFPATGDEIRRSYVDSKGQISNPAFNVYGITFPKIIDDFRSSFQRNAVRKALNKNFSSLWRGVILGSALGWDTTDGKRLLYIRNCYNYRYFLPVLFLFLLPSSFLATIYRAFKFFKKISERIFLC